MLTRLRSLLTGSDPAETIDPDRRLQLAAVALLIETGRADHEQDEREQQAIRQAAQQVFGLDAEELEQLVAEAHAHQSAATSLYEFTSLINQHYAEGEKYQLIRLMWQVAYADGNIDRYEDHLIRKVAELLYLPHSQFIRAKLSVISADT
ncbi:MAG: TerB family tellurite resistance protein [Spongiibacteraceae bacterium]|jgi:uncharacterized tellurite resistance protein B-like protein|nr:TerB family tellurite resistance protein [Spongiibacteraceae bacterium]